jgi:hypothetical protein
MGDITLDAETHDRLSLLALAWEIDEGAAVARLIARLGSMKSNGSEPPVSVGIYMEYRGVRVDAEYYPKTQAVTIMTGPGSLPGLRFKKPSPAACEVVRTIAPEMDPHRNGWKHWHLTETDDPLQTIRYAG